MASIKPNAARLKSVTEFKPRDLTDRTEIGPTPLGALIVAIQEFLAEKDPEVVMANLRDAVVDYLAKRPVLMDMADFIAAKARGPRDPPRRRGHRQPHPPPAAAMMREDLSRSHGDTETLRRRWLLRVFVSP